jgi:hypothetical protein
VALVWLIVSLLAEKPSPAALLARLLPFVLPLAALAALAIAIVAALSGVLRDGTYTTARSAAYASAALLGLAALEPTRAAGLRRFAFVLFLLAPAMS